MRLRKIPTSVTSAIIATATIAALLIMLITIDEIQNADLPYHPNEKNLTDLTIQHEDASFGGRTLTRIPLLEATYLLLEGILGSLGARAALLLAFASSLFLLTALAARLADSHYAALFALLLIASSPVVLAKPLAFNDALLAVPLLLMMLFLLESKRTAFPLLLSAFLLVTLVNLTSALIILALIIAHTIAVSHGKAHDTKRIELIFAFLALFGLALLLFFREPTADAILTLSPHLTTIDDPLSVLQRILSLGPLLLAAASASAYLIYARKMTWAYTTLALSAVSLAMMLISDHEIYTTTFAFTAAAMSAIAFSYLFGYVSVSKIADYRKALSAAIAIFIIIAGTAQSAVTITTTLADLPGENELRAYEFVRERTSEDAIIFTPIERASVAAYYTQRTPLITKDFTGVADPDRWHSDHTVLTTARSTLRALHVINAHSIEALIFTEPVPFYLNETERDQRCFETHDFTNIQVFFVRCSIS